ncbi:MAG: hypothetical protein P2A85_04290 [Microcoleus anatoxicus]
MPRWRDAVDVKKIFAVAVSFSIELSFYHFQGRMGGEGAGLNIGDFSGR